MIRVRFAPSPTGPLHIGGVRTALYNYLFAKKNNGQFILRIEDTDQTRYVPQAEAYIEKSLAWLGITPEESPSIGGKFAPYRQSERREIYKKYIDQLIKNKKAYYAFDTKEELDAMRERLASEKSSVQLYNSQTRTSMRNSFTLSQEETEELLANNTPYVIRFDMPSDRTLTVQDLVRGKITVETSTLDDKILFKSDGLPTYHFANIVDDHLMEISHVIRGEEWLPSMPLHILLYEALGWQAPQFAHLPLILKPDGKGKLSKRDGAKHGFPVFPLEWQVSQDEVYAGYKEFGYLPQAVNNLLAFLGWNPGTEQEIYSLSELAELFDLQKVQKGGAKFNPDKAKWFNAEHLKQISSETLAERFQKTLDEKGISYSDKNLIHIIDLVRERASFETDLWEISKYFFVPPTEYDKKSVKKAWKTGAAEIVKEVSEIILSQENFSSQHLETVTKEWITSHDLNFGKVLNPIRLLIVGATGGVHLFDIIEVIGRDDFRERISRGIEKL